MTCDFETVDGGCLFDDIADDDFDWTRNSVSLFLYYDYLFTIILYGRMKTLTDM